MSLKHLIKDKQLELTIICRMEEFRIVGMAIEIFILIKQRIMARIKFGLKYL